MTQNRWTRTELIVAFNLYLKLPFGKIHTGTKEIQALAALIGRSPSSIAMRLSNFAHVDPYHQQRGVVGLAGGAKQVQPIWDEFIDSQEELVFESERMLADYQHRTVEETYPDIAFDLKSLHGEEKIRAVRTRVNQRVFRLMVLKTYANQCAVSGINLPELLVAGHIVPWAVNERERLNTENGICLSHLYDRAYELGLICIDVDYKLLISRRLKAESDNVFYQQFFGRFEHQLIHLPTMYRPKQEFLAYRLEFIRRLKR